MGKFDFRLIPEEMRPKPKEPPTKEEREKMILETIEQLKECKKKLASIVTEAEHDQLIRIDITMLQNMIDNLDFSITRTERIEKIHSELGR